MNDVLSYAVFTNAEGGKWPEWKSLPDSFTVLSPPSASAIESYCNHKYKEVRSNYLGDSTVYLAQYNNNVV